MFILDYPLGITATVGWLRHLNVGEHFGQGRGSYSCKENTIFIKLALQRVLLHSRWIGKEAKFVVATEYQILPFFVYVIEGWMEIRWVMMLKSFLYNIAKSSTLNI